MLETKDDKMLVTVVALLVTNIHYRFTLASGTNILKMSPTSKFCQQHSKINTNVKSPPSLSPFLTSVTIFQVQRNFPTSAKLWKKLSKFARVFSTSLGSFQLKQILYNLKLFNFSFFPSALSNYMYSPIFNHYNDSYHDPGFMCIF